MFVSTKLIKTIRMKNIFMVIRLTLFAFLLLSTPVYSGETANGDSFSKHLLILKAYDPSGVWNAEVEVPGQTVELIITISKDDEGDFEVSMEDTTDNETVELEEISFDEEEMIMTGEVNVDGITMDVVMEFDGDSVEGKVSAEGMEMKLTGERETD